MTSISELNRLDTHLSRVDEIFVDNASKVTFLEGVIEDLSLITSPGKSNFEIRVSNLLEKYKKKEAELDMLEQATGQSREQLSEEHAAVKRAAAKSDRVGAASLRPDVALGPSSGIDHHEEMLSRATGFGLGDLMQQDLAARGTSVAESARSKSPEKKKDLDTIGTWSDYFRGGVNPEGLGADVRETSSFVCRGLYGFARDYPQTFRAIKDSSGRIHAAACFDTTERCIKFIARNPESLSPSVNKIKGIAAALLFLMAHERVTKQERAGRDIKRQTLLTLSAEDSAKEFYEKIGFANLAREIKYLSYPVYEEKIGRALKLMEDEGLSYCRIDSN